MNISNNKKDIYEHITHQIVEALEQGTSIGRLPWHTVETAHCHITPVNAVSKKPYRGINILTLWVEAEQKGYTTGLWATYTQWRDLGCQVKKGEQSTLVVFWKFTDHDVEEDQEAELTQQRLVMAKGYSVFNAAQVDGFAQPASTPEPGRLENAERFFSNLNADIRHGGNNAFYSPTFDYIQLPTFHQFESPESYYSVLSHESTHWTGAPGRLNRDLAKRFGDETYAAEELIAELGAAFLCAELDISNEPRPDHASYIASWLDVLNNDKRAIFTAASKAQQAVDWMKAHQISQQAA